MGQGIMRFKVWFIARGKFRIWVGVAIKAGIPTQG